MFANIQQQKNNVNGELGNTLERRAGWGGRCWIPISADTLAFVTELFRNFPQFLQEDSGIVPRLG
jgi:hypothetical protein